jgi:hypothetical protein
MLRNLSQLIILAMLGCSGGTGHSPPALARIQLEPSVIDLGLIGTQPGQIGKAEFRLMNRGSEILKLLGVKSSCGCTVLQFPSREIRPGDDEVVKVHVDPRNESGAHSAEIVIQTNDPVQPAVSVLVRWTERTAITLVANHLEFGWVKSDETIEADVTLELANQIDPHGLHFESSYPGLKIVHDESSVMKVQNGGNGRQKKIRLVIAARSETGHHSTELRIVSSDRKSFARLPISWRTGPRVEVTPKAIFRSNLRPGSFFECQLFVRAADESSTVVHKVEYDGQCLEYETQPLDASTKAGSIVTFNLQADAAVGIKEHLIRLTIGDSSDEIFVVPVTLVIR